MWFDRVCHNQNLGTLKMATVLDLFFRNKEISADITKIDPELIKKNKHSYNSCQQWI